MTFSEVEFNRILEACSLDEPSTEHRVTRLSNRALVAKLYPRIVGHRRSGYSLEGICEWLRKNGAPMSASTLRKYLQLAAAAGGDANASGGRKPRANAGRNESANAGRNSGRKGPRKRAPATAERAGAAPLASPQEAPGEPSATDATTVERPSATPGANAPAHRDALLAPPLTRRETEWAKDDNDTLPRDDVPQTESPLSSTEDRDTQEHVRRHAGETAAVAPAAREDERAPLQGPAKPVPPRGLDTAQLENDGLRFSGTPPVAAVAPRKGTFVIPAEIPEDEA